MSTPATPTDPTTDPGNPFEGDGNPVYQAHPDTPPGDDADGSGGGTGAIGDGGLGEG